MERNLDWHRVAGLVKQKGNTMRNPVPSTRIILSIILATLVGMVPVGAGVTLITHGLNGNVDGWVTGMATNVPNHPGFRGTNFSCYNLTFVPAGGGGFTLNATRTAGVAATNADSGAIIIKLDWSDLADGNSYDTYQVAAAVLPALLSTNFITELGGHALAEFPLHLIGHSRGGSLWCEVSRLLGTNGIWVDHLTTLDPHPLNDPDFPFDGFLYDAVDAPANTYVNVLFHDNYWQNINSLVRGKAVAGAYVRRLTTLDGGYSAPHSDVHLWYHATLQLTTPAHDTEVSLMAPQRTNWWTTYEQRGTNAGFLYSLTGGADRTSTAQPLGGGFPMIREGFNQWWDLGAGVANNRTALPGNNGAWPSVLKINRMTLAPVAVGEALPMLFYYQWAHLGTSPAIVRFHLDVDGNPLNANEVFLQEIDVPATGPEAIGIGATNLILTAMNLLPGTYRVLATITGSGRTRHLYGPETVEVIGPRQPPTLDIAKLNATQYRISVIGVPGQTVVLQSSPDLQTWLPLATNMLETTRWDFTNAPSHAPGAFYYRGMLP